MSKWARKEDESKNKLSEESAEAAVRELLDFYEVDTRRPNPEHEKILDEGLDDLAKAYRRGVFENKKDETLGFCVVQHLKNGDTLTYREVGGKERVYFESLDENKAISKIYAMLGRLCGLGEDVIMKLKGGDWQDAKNLSMVFTMASNG